MKTKTALQRLAFRIAEELDNMPHLDNWADFSLEEVYRLIYAQLPPDMEALAAKQEALWKPFRPIGPSPMAKLREAVHADKGTPIKEVIEAACAAIKERDMLRQKIAHGCTDALCETCGS